MACRRAVAVLAMPCLRLALKDARRFEGISFDQLEHLREQLRVTSTADKHHLTRVSVLTDESIYLFVFELSLLSTRRGEPVKRNPGEDPQTPKGTSIAKFT